MRDEDIHRDAAVLAPKKRSLKDGATAARRGGALMLGCGVPATATFSTGKRTSDDLRRGARVSTRGRGGGTTSRSPTWTDDPIGGGGHLEAATGARVATRRAGAAVRARTGAPRIMARLEVMDCCIV